MSLTLVTAPTVEPISLAEARLHLRLDADANGHPDDALVTASITAAREYVDGRDGWLGRALTTQTWELRLKSFAPWIRIPLPPLQAVVSVKYIDNDGVEQTVPTSTYQVSSDEPAVITPKYGEVWPTARNELDAVRIRFRAGYGDSAANIPQPIKSALLLHVGVLYRDREPTGAQQVYSLPMTYDALLASYKVW